VTAAGQPLDVMHVCAPAVFGGLESVLRMLLRGQVEAGLRVGLAAIVGSQAPEAPLLEALAGDGVMVDRIRTRPRAYFSQLARLRELRGKYRPTVVHSHGYQADVLTSLLPSAPHMARVTTVHGFTGGGRKNRLYEWLQCRSFSRFDVIVAVSNKLRADLATRGVKSESLAVVVNGYAGGPMMDRASARSALELPPDLFVLGWVGRLSHEKGPDVLVDAMSDPAGVPGVIVFIGDGPARSALSATVEARGLGSRVRWAGPRPDASSLMKAFDVFVLSSRTEGTPIVLFEAMRARIPLVVTAVGGVPEVVTSDQAVLVAPADPASLAAAIRAIPRDPAGAGERAERAAARLEQHYSVTGWVASYQRVYEMARRQSANA
jgi:glycosyltransferase involved in cell wall biosynthesis